MHVLMTADTLGGVWTYVRELASELVRRGVRVTLVSFGEIPTLEQSAWMDGLDLLDFRPTGFKLEWMQECDDDLAASAGYLRMVVDEVSPDLLHFNQYFYGALDFAQPARPQPIDEDPRAILRRRQLIGALDADARFAAPRSGGVPIPGG